MQTSQIQTIKYQCALEGCEDWFVLRRCDGNNKRYCSYICSREAKKRRDYAWAKNNRQKVVKAALGRRKETQGRYCKYCRALDKHTLWSALTSVCSTCDRQRHRVGSCKRCEGLLYYNPRTTQYYCPNCEPRQPQDGEVSITMVCEETGREREIVRSMRWRLPTGEIARNRHIDGYIVIDVDAVTWTRIRA